ncbi:MAG: S41 family peptidase [Prevotellaceae bacterium]|jgi:carboxyl-terminal processing protease|nr:S41 family peptidase [Prevotellaceae bacterium]
MNSKTKILLPLIIAVSVCVGILMGNFLLGSGVSFHKKTPPQLIYNNKIDYLLDLINQRYVDSLDFDQLTEDAATQIITELDPHSAYIPATELEEVNNELEGSFSGIGVQFNILNDTVMIVDVINGGPSEKLGIQPGDRIVRVDDSLFVGKEITNEKVQKTLKGEKGTVVKVEIKRSSSKELLTYKIVRGTVPVNSVDISYMIEPETGYIKVSKFGRTTYDEFIAAIYQLKRQNAAGFIIDLRGNAGGYLDAAIAMIDEFLPKERLIVYTEGHFYPREDYVSSGKGSSIDNKIVVLIDEWSASASEIFAGAIQDNDRGSIIGRRSFGKGLVQNQFPLPDGAAVRLTVARYYTPSGRYIQKPYERGANNEYELEVYERYLSGELDHPDSISTAVDTVEFRTIGGRIVHGGGGIMPDISVPRDTVGHTAFFNKLINKGYVYQFAFDYADQNRQALSEMKTWQEIDAYLIENEVIEELLDYAESKGLRRNPYSFYKSRTPIQNLLTAYVSRNILGERGFYPVLNRRDPVVIKALETINKN